MDTANLALKGLMWSATLAVVCLFGKWSKDCGHCGDASRCGKVFEGEFALFRAASSTSLSFFYAVKQR